jgi:anti-sigma factor RsiW
MTCRDTEKLLDLFLDGELEARAMRTVALHVTRCAACEGDLQHRERVQDAVAETFADAVAEVDFSTFWPSVETRIAAPPGPWRGRARRAAHRLAAAGRSPLVATATTAAAVALAALLLWRGLPPPAAPPAARNNQVRIESLASDARSVALFSEPETQTTVIWVVDEGDVQ